MIAAWSPSVCLNIIGQRWSFCVSAHCGPHWDTFRTTRVDGLTRIPCFDLLACGSDSAPGFITGLPTRTVEIPAFCSLDPEWAADLESGKMQATCSTIVNVPPVKRSWMMWSSSCRYRLIPEVCFLSLEPSSPSDGECPVRIPILSHILTYYVNQWCLL